MPINNSLEPVKLPASLGLDKEINTEFIDHLDAIQVTLTNSPSFDDLCDYLPAFVSATWAEEPFHLKDLSEIEKAEIIHKIFIGKLLPTALETIGLTFAFEGIDTQFVTHLCRHRAFSLSAQCTGDRNQRNDSAVVPSPIMNSPEYLERWKKLVNDSKQLYADMVDSKKISIMDARHILPKCLKTFYFVRGNIKDILGFIRQRTDKQIQPTEDNVIAYMMWLEILKEYPVLVDIIDIHTPARYYINTARTGTGTNLYYPDKDSDIFEYNENDFLYKCPREKLNGTNGDELSTFSEIINFVDLQIEDTRKYAYKKYPFLNNDK